MFPAFVRRRQPRRAGAAVVEVALTLPIFILMSVGMLEFGRGFMVQQMVTNAAREGARQAVLAGATNETVTARVEDLLAAGRIDPGVVWVQYNPANVANAKSGDQVRVRVWVNYADVAWMPGARYMGNTDLASETVMRRE